jgi:O-antigen/teichoic acid export membrane protein
MTALTRPAPTPTPASPAPADAAPGGRAVRDSLVVSLGGQLERLLGTFTALALRWGLDPARLGVYTGLRLFLDNTNRSSLGVGLGAVQEIPVLRARGREAEAAHLADVAHTTNAITCLAYALGLVAWAAWRAPSRAADPLGFEWTWGLVAVAGLALLKRHESFLIAVLRAHGAYALTTRAEVLESVVSAVAVALGLGLAGFWGLLAAVAVIAAVKIAYLQGRHPMRFAFAWDLPLAWRLMRTGLPILANTAVFGCVLGLDRALILGLVPGGERAVGLYSIALLGTNWSLDLAGRIGLVLYNDFLGELGRTERADRVARRSLRATEAQGPILVAGAAVAYVLAPDFLGWLIPRYAEGLPALRPLLPGMVLLGLAWPSRQLLIATGRPYRLLAATLAGLALTAGAGALGATRAGIVGVAWGMTFGYAAVFACSSAAATLGALGVAEWLGHLRRLAALGWWYAAGALVAAHGPFGTPGLAGTAARGLFLALWALPALALWARSHGWGVDAIPGLRRATRRGGPR